ncbi:MAG: hypothetical protein ACMXX7_02595 [Candidatus Woesearchaeota archaeon]
MKGLNDVDEGIEEIVNEVKLYSELRQDHIYTTIENLAFLINANRFGRPVGTSKEISELTKDKLKILQFAIKEKEAFYFEEELQKYFGFMQDVVSEHPVLPYVLRGIKASLEKDSREIDYTNHVLDSKLDDIVKKHNSYKWLNTIGESKHFVKRRLNQIKKLVTKEILDFAETRKKAQSYKQYEIYQERLYDYMEFYLLGQMPLILKKSKDKKTSNELIKSIVTNTGFYLINTGGISFPKNRLDENRNHFEFSFKYDSKPELVDKMLIVTDSLENNNFYKIDKIK